VFEPNGAGRFPLWKEAGVKYEPVLFPRGPHKPTSYNWGSMYSTIIFKSKDPAKQRAAVQAALGALSDDAQAAHAAADTGLPVTKSGKESPAFQSSLTRDPQLKAFADMFPYCGVDPAIPCQGEMRQIMDAMMLKIYSQQEAIKSGLQEAERQVQVIHDADLAASKK
jgi:maltose-binding protein MalE